MARWFLDQGGEKEGKFAKMKVHDVPYRSLLPEKPDGVVLVARRVPFRPATLQRQQARAWEIAWLSYMRRELPLPWLRRRESSLVT